MTLRATQCCMFVIGYCCAAMHLRLALYNIIALRTAFLTVMHYVQTIIGAIHHMTPAHPSIYT